MSTFSRKSVKTQSFPSRCQLRPVIDDKKKYIEEAYNLMIELNQHYRKNASNDTPPDDIDILKEPYLINAYYIELLPKTEKENLVFSKDRMEPAFH